MKSNEITSLVSEIVYNISKTEELKIDVDEELLLSGILDSMAVISLTMELEQHFGIQIPAFDITIENYETIEAMSQYLVGRLA